MLSSCSHLLADGSSMWMSKSCAEKRSLELAEGVSILLWDSEADLTGKTTEVGFYIKRQNAQEGHIGLPHSANTQEGAQHNQRSSHPCSQSHRTHMAELLHRMHALMQHCLVVPFISFKPEMAACCHGVHNVLLTVQRHGSFTCRSEFGERDIASLHKFPLPHATTSW